MFVRQGPMFVRQCHFRPSSGRFRQFPAQFAPFPAISGPDQAQIRLNLAGFRGLAGEIGAFWGRFCHPGPSREAPFRKM